MSWQCYYVLVATEQIKLDLIEIFVNMMVLVEEVYLKDNFAWLILDSRLGSMVISSNYPISTEHKENLQKGFLKLYLLFISTYYYIVTTNPNTDNNKQLNLCCGKKIFLN